eukprot:Opistho-2@14839
MTDDKNGGGDQDDKRKMRKSRVLKEVDIPQDFVGKWVHRLFKFYIRPVSTKWVRWEMLMVCFITITCILDPYKVAFDFTGVGGWAVLYLLDFFFLVDMFLQFHMAFMQEGFLETDSREMAVNYLRTHFTIDTLSVFPIEFIAFAFPGYELRVLAICRLNRLLRVYRLVAYFNRKENELNANTSLVRVVKFIVYVVVLTHWIACLFYVSGCHSGRSLTCESGSWATQLLRSNRTGVHLDDSSTATRYILTLYWAVTTTTTTGYGDVVPFTNGEKVYALLVMLVGSILYGFISGSITSTMANADSQRVRYFTRLQAVTRYMRDQSLANDLHQRVSEYFEYLWLRNRGKDHKTLFVDMPLTFQAEVALSINKDIIDRVPLFQNTDVGFQRMLSLVIKPFLYLPREFIVNKGDIGREMFFIHRGRVEVVSEDGQTIYATMESGSFFGEISLIFSVPRTASIRAATHCDLFVLTKRDLDSVLHHYPEISKQIQAIAKARFESAERRAEETKDESAVEIPAEAEAEPEVAGVGAGVISSIRRKISRKQEPATVTRRSLARQSLIDRSFIGPMKRLVIMPDSAFARLWHPLRVALTCIGAITITYQAAFVPTSVGLWVFNYPMYSALI